MRLAPFGRVTDTTAMEGETLFEEFLINCIRNYPSLWTVNSKKHHDIEAANNIWNEIAQVVGKDAETCKSRWRSLRDTYRRKMEKLPSGSGRSNSRKWMWLGLLGSVHDVMM